MNQRTSHKLIAVALGWMIAATVVLAVPNPADASTSSSVSDAATVSGIDWFGERVTDARRVHADVASFNLAVAADVPEICETVPDAGPACDPNYDPNTPAPEPEPEPEPEPTRDPHADARESADAAKAAAIASIEEPHWIIYPPDNRQIVGLESFLYIADNYTATSAVGPEIGDQQVTVTAVPGRSNWSFRETETGRTSSVSCAGRGQEWTPGATDPACGKRYFHSSDVTGTVELEVCVQYRVSWSHQYASGNENHEACSTVPGELTVLEVMTWGIDRLDEAAAVRPSEPVVHEPKIECSWKAKTVAWVLPGIGCEPIQRIGDLISNFLGGCGDSIFSKFGELWGVITGLGSDPVGYVKEQIAGLQAMYDQLMDPETRNDMIIALGRDVLYFEEDDVIADFTADDWANWAGKIICGFAFDYLSGTATGKIFDYLKGRLPNGPDAPDAPDTPDTDLPDTDPDAPDTDPDAPETDPPETEEPETPLCLTPQSSFPAGTLVVMDDGAHLPIDDIRPGDRVLSYNVDTSVWEPKLVLAQWSHHDRGPPATAYLRDGASITATNDHRFYAPDTGEWIELQHLRTGDAVLTPNGPIELANVTVGPAHPWTVWELTVDGNHNFTVLAGDTPLLVHNEGHGPCNPNAGVPEGGTATSWDEDGNPLTYKDENGDIHDLRPSAEVAARAQDIIDEVLANGDTPILGRFPEVGEAGAIDGQWNLDVEDWSPELNDAIMDALIEAGEPITLVSDPLNIGLNDRGLPPVYQSEIDALTDAGWTLRDNGDGTWTAEPPTGPPGDGFTVELSDGTTFENASFDADGNVVTESTRTAPNANGTDTAVTTQQVYDPKTGQTTTVETKTKFEQTTHPDGTSTLVDTQSGTTTHFDANGNPTSGNANHGGQLPPFDGGATAGTIEVGGQSMDLTSGATGPAWPGMDGQTPNVTSTLSHVESHAAALLGATDEVFADLQINHPQGICQFCVNQNPGQFLGPDQIIRVTSPAGVEYITANGVFDQIPPGYSVP